jgi:hypothetical protein
MDTGTTPRTTGKSKALLWILGIVGSPIVGIGASWVASSWYSGAPEPNTAPAMALVIAPVAYLAGLLGMPRRSVGVLYLGLAVVLFVLDFTPFGRAASRSDLHYSRSSPLLSYLAAIAAMPGYWAGKLVRGKV